MEKLIFTNSMGQSVELTDSAPYVLRSIKGGGGVKADTQLINAPYQDGKTYLDTLLKEKLMTLEVMVVSETEKEYAENRRKISSIFNPKFGIGKLRYILDTYEKEIEVVAQESPLHDISLQRSNRLSPINIHVVAPKPFWEDINYTTQDMADWIGGIKFPLRLGTQFSRKGDKLVFNNTGDVSSPIEVRFIGGATNPTITKEKPDGTVEYIRVIRKLEDTEQLVITTEFGNKRVEIEDAEGVRHNAMHYIDLGSTFFSLDVGPNLIGYHTEAIEKTRVRVSWKKRFLSI